MNEKLKQKFNRAKTKIKEHAPEILGFTVAVIGAVIAVKTIKKDLSNPVGYAVVEQEPTEGIGYSSMEDEQIDRAHITADEMKRGLEDKTILAYSVEGNSVTFYDISEPED